MFVVVGGFVDELIVLAVPELFELEVSEEDDGGVEIVLKAWEVVVGEETEVVPEVFDEVLGVEDPEEEVGAALVSTGAAATGTDGKATTMMAAMNNVNFWT